MFIGNFCSIPGLLKLWVAIPFGIAKLNFGVAKHRATMTFQSKWGRQLKKFKKC